LVFGVVVGIVIALAKIRFIFVQKITLVLKGFGILSSEGEK
jgi:hypothetical protein